MKLKQIWSTLLLCGCLFNPLYASFTVNSNLDTPDALIGNGVCADASGVCTLRAAIQEANAAGVNCLITFSAGFGGLITLTSNLPIISTDLIISGGILGNVTIDGDGMFAAFNINGSTVSMSDLIIQNTNGSSGPAINNSGDLTISNSTIQDNNITTSFGGVIHNMGTMNIIKSTIDGNSATSSSVIGGGALYNWSGAMLNITQSTFSNNSTMLSGTSCSSGRPGGAIFNDGEININASTFSGNVADACNATSPGGGAIYGSMGSTTTVANSTVSGNTSIDGVGGGISMQGTLILDNSTIVNNTAEDGGGLEARSATLQITSTIIADSNPASTRDLLIASSVTLAVNNNNLIESCGSTFTCSLYDFSLTVDPELKALADNGGCTETHLPCTTSPVIDAGQTSNSGPTDQRDLTAPIDSPSRPDSLDGNDIGSVELQASELPVELIAFQVKLIDRQVLLTWITASEINNSGFEVQHSRDAQTWESLTFIKGFGTSLEPHSYKWLDEFAEEGQNYYRLRQIDYDQQVNYSDIRSVYLTKSVLQLNVFPNPVKEQLFFQFSIDWSESPCLFLLYDAHGRLVREWVRYDDKSTPLPLNNLPNGIYILSAHYGRLSFNELVVKE